MTVTAVAAAALAASASSAGANPVLVVKSTADSGPNTLRNQLATANATPGPDRIEFDISGPAPHVIMPATQLPAVTETLTIDAATQPGFSTSTHKPVVVLDGSAPAGFASGLVVQGTAAGGTQIRGLQIVRWTAYAIRIDGTPDVVIAGNYVGTDGVAALGNGSGFMTQAGVVAAYGESRNLRIGGRTPADRNVIAGNDSAQIYLLDTVGTRVQGNYLGVNAAGTAAVVPGGAHGIVVENSDGLVTIGGSRSGEGNVVSGNVYGIVFAGGEFVVAGNRVGTNAAGTAAIPNERGITVFFGGPVTIGGTTAGARNLISGNGVGIDLNGASNELVQGNWIGTDAQGKAAVPNDVGIFLGGIFSQPGDDNLVGGSAPGAGNVISGNRVGIRIEDGNNNVMLGNRIGTGPDGKRPLPNTGNGIEIVNSGGNTSTGNRIGGIVAGAGNVIAFNGGAGGAVGGGAGTPQKNGRGDGIRGEGGAGLRPQ